MKNVKGFTLLELLIAAAIIGTLAIFATQSFRRTASDTRVQDAQARAKIVAMAAQRFAKDYPAVVNGTAPIREQEDDDGMGVVDPPNPAQCNAGGVELSLQNLINCGYLEYRQYAYEVRAEDGSYGRNFNMFFYVHNGVWVCVNRLTAKILDNNTYCSDGYVVSSFVGNGRP